MESMIIKDSNPAEGGSEFRATIGYGGCIEITRQLREGFDRMGSDQLIARIPREKRFDLGNFILNAK